jgi:hypothetical protein
MERIRNHIAKSSVREIYDLDEEEEKRFNYFFLEILNVYVETKFIKKLQNY